MPDKRHLKVKSGLKFGTKSVRYQSKEKNRTDVLHMSLNCTILSSFKCLRSETNKLIFEIAEICRINKKITCHVARHSFATLCMTPGVPIESVSKMLGHSNIRTTQTYARIIDQKLSSDINMLAEKLNQNNKNTVEEKRIAL